MRTKRPVLSSRKKPQQTRSREVVEAVLQATTYLLLRGGYEALTTNRIAERAGVNIASLYRYFPNKEAIVAELMRRHIARTRAAVVPAASRHDIDDLSARVRAVIEVVAAEHAVEPRLHAIFSELGPRIGFKRDTGLDPALASAGDAWTRAASGRLPDPALSLWVAQTAVHAVFHAAFSERPDVAARPQLVDELVRLVTSYLNVPTPSLTGKRP
ncbi:MAG TPA: TetR/AcrR family transcriptional regulator [Polyangia bacterium]|nr:TetR/AcrR family transcriptional regulator [Polyangia bacterium]